MLALTSATIVMLIAIALIIGWTIGRKAARRHQAKKTRVTKEPERVHFAARTDQHTPKEKMKRKLPASRRTIGR